MCVSYIRVLILMVIMSGVCFSTATAQDAPGLAGTSWQLVSIKYSDGKILTPADKSRYTIAFGADDRVAARIDCNRGSGTWKSEGPGRLQFGPLALTKMMCPPGSLDNRVVKDWSNFRTYLKRAGHLFLSLMADGGAYEFEPLGGSQATLFGMKWKLVEVEGAQVTGSRAFIEFDSATNRASGDGGCNRFSGSFEVNGTSIKFSRMISTKRACIDEAIQRVENRLMINLEATTAFQIQDDLLSLKAADRAVLAFRSDSAEAKSRVTGTVKYLQRIALPRTAIVKVTLADVSRADAPAVKIAEQIIKASGRQVPFAFDLSYDAGRIKQNGRYAVQARITNGGRLLFTSTGSYPVITSGNPTSVDVIVKPVRR